jgi:hypothetical protein
MKKIKFGIEKDLVDKEAAIDIDEQTSHLKVTGPMKRTRETRYPVAKPKQSFTPSTWQENTEGNLDLANKQIKACLALQVDGVFMDSLFRHWKYHLFFDIISYLIISQKNDIISFISYR